MLFHGLKFAKPPIVEVVCGFQFAPLEALDLVALGILAKSLLADYPKRQVQPLLSDVARFVLGTDTHQRLWLTSADDAYVLQLQWDRFLLNWRSMGTVYPRFSDHASESGLLSTFLKQFERFERLCGSELQLQPVPRALELTKVDRFKQNLHWSDTQDLGQLFPTLAGVLARCAPALQSKGLAESERRPQLHCSFEQSTARGRVRVAMTLLSEPGGAILQMETRHTGPLGASPRESFELANEAVNEAFFDLIPEAEHVRFE